MISSCGHSRQALACLTPDYLVADPPTIRRSAVTFLATGEERGAIRLPSRHPQLRAVGFLAFRLIHGYELVAEGTGWQLHTMSYTYEFIHPDGREIIAYHYDPRPNARVQTPHCHVRGLIEPLPLSRAHFPTGRVSIEEIVRFAITELRVPPRYPDVEWQARLAATEALFAAQRRW